MWTYRSQGTPNVWDAEEIALHDFSVFTCNDTHHWYKCSHCDLEKNATQFKISHSGGTATCTDKKVCEVCNLAYGKPLGHDYGEIVYNGDNTHTKTCSRDSSHTVTENCHGGDPCTERPICVDCNTVYGEILGHNYGEWISNGDGTHSKTCANYNEHKITEACTGEATCTAKAICEKCDKPYVANEHVYDNEHCKWCNASEGLKYTLSNDSYYLSGIGTCNHTDIVIPSTYNGKPVTAIGSSAFYGCDSLTSITIPNSVTSIGSSAFSGCSSLKSITIPFVGAKAGVTSSDTYQYPFGYIFGTSSYTGSYSAEQHYYGSSTSRTTYTTYKIPSSLKSVTITGGNILLGAFYECSSLTSVVIGDSVTGIVYSAFEGCSSLKSVKIGNSVTRIAGGAFYDCRSLTSVVIGDSVTSIASEAFCGCSKLTSIVIPDSVTSIGYKAFERCSSLTSIKYRGTESQWQAITKDYYWDYKIGNYTITYNYTGE